MPTDEFASHQRLRSYAAFLVFLGWTHVIVFTLAGFAPWLFWTGQAVSAASPWGQWALYAAPAAGLLIGAFSALAYFIVSGVIRVLIEQRDLLEEILQEHRRLLRVAEARQSGGRPSEADPIGLDFRGADERTL